MIYDRGHRASMETTGCHGGHGGYRGQQEATGEVSWWLQAPQNMITSAYIMIYEDIENLWENLWSILDYP